MLLSYKTISMKIAIIYSSKKHIEIKYNNNDKLTKDNHHKTQFIQLSGNYFFFEKDPFQF